jgi:ribosomal protein S18 acetylase RimI-like enzyme
MSIRTAVITDADELYHLVNSAYRGESSKAGWTTEADLLGGLRINRTSLEKIFSDPKETILVHEVNGRINGCVQLTDCGDGDYYLGMLTVDPKQQGQGVGAKLLAESEEYVRQKGAKRIHMTVISVRHELIAYYERKGYRRANVPLIPFPESEDYVILKEPLQFLTLEKVF